MLTFKKGLLYKYNKWCNGNLFTRDYVNESKSICPYFWGSVWNVVFVNTFYLTMLIVLGLLFSVIPVELLGLFTGWVGDQGTWLYFVKSVLVGVSTVLTIGAIFVPVDMWVAFLCKFERKLKSADTVVEWVKATKNKVCPMIQWEG